MNGVKKFLAIFVGGALLILIGTRFLLWFNRNVQDVAWLRAFSSLAWLLAIGGLALLFAWLVWPRHQKQAEGPPANPN